MTESESAPPVTLPRQAMRHPYLVRSDKAYLTLSLLDAVLRPLRKPAAPIPQSITRIVVANGAHLGDVLLTLPAIAAVRQAHPQAHIGMVVGSWSKSVAEWSGLLDEVHVFDHWMHNRTAYRRLSRHRKTRGDTLQVLRERRYQLGIDFYPFFPPTHPLFYQASIPVRVGFDSGGFGPLLTHPVGWRNANTSFTEHLRDLLIAVNCAPATGAPFRFNRPRPTRVPIPLTPNQYILLHPGAGAPYKDWGIDNWRQLAADLRARGEIIVLTGAGARENEMAQQLKNLVDINLVGLLAWNEFAEVVGGAKAVICPDTATGHLAAIFKVPTVSIFTGTNNLHHWAPANPRAKAILNHVPCSPCYRRGCATMQCIRGTSPGDVLAALEVVMTISESVRTT